MNNGRKSSHGSDDLDDLEDLPADPEATSTRPSAFESSEEPVKTYLAQMGKAIRKLRQPSRSKLLAGFATETLAV